MRDARCLRNLEIITENGIFVCGVCVIVQTSQASNTRIALHQPYRILEMYPCLQKRPLSFKEYGYKRTTWKCKHPERYRHVKDFAEGARFSNFPDGCSHFITNLLLRIQRCTYLLLIALQHRSDTHRSAWRDPDDWLRSSPQGCLARSSWRSAWSTHCLRDNTHRRPIYIYLIASRHGLVCLREWNSNTWPPLESAHKRKNSETFTQTNDFVQNAWNANQNFSKRPFWALFQNHNVRIRATADCLQVHCVQVWCDWFCTKVPHCKRHVVWFNGWLWYGWVTFKNSFGPVVDYFPEIRRVDSSIIVVFVRLLCFQYKRNDAWTFLQEHTVCGQIQGDNFWKISHFRFTWSGRTKSSSCDSLFFICRFENPPVKHHNNVWISVLLVKSKTFPGLSKRKTVAVNDVRWLWRETSSQQMSRKHHIPVS